MKCLANKTTEKKVRQDAIKQTAHFMAVIVASIVTDKYGYGKQKTQQLLTSIMEGLTVLLKAMQVLKTMKRYSMKSMIFGLIEV